MGGPKSLSPAVAARPAVLRNPSTGGREWYHGTRASAAALAGGLKSSEYSQDMEALDPSHWNALLGVHFAAHHRSADKFARPGSGYGGQSSSHGWEGRDTPSVVHARLHMSNPKVYASEHEMADDAFEHEYDQRKNYISKYIEADDERLPYAAGTYFSFDHDPRERPSRGEWENFSDWHEISEQGAGDQPEPVYRRTQWLNLHPDKAGIVQRFRDRLQAQGHDGIVYGNSEPGERVRSSRPESNMAAIAFHPGQIEITKHHVYGDEHRTAAIRYDEDGDEIGQNPERYVHEETSPGHHRFSALDRWDNELGYADVRDHGSHIWLKNLYVHPDDRGRGTGGQLVENVVSHFPGRQIRLHPHPSPEGWESEEDMGPDHDELRDFYEGHGFSDYHPSDEDGHGRDDESGAPFEHMVRHGSAYAPSTGIFAPTTGLDTRLFDEQMRMRPAVTEAIVTRLDVCIRTDAQVAGSEWQQWARVYVAGGSASEWAGNRPNDQAQDLDVLVGVDFAKARYETDELKPLSDDQIVTALNAAFRHCFNDPAWQAPFGGTWDLTAYCNRDAWDIAAIRPYAAYRLWPDAGWAVKPPHMPEHTLADFDPAVLAEARAVAAQARAILRLPEPMRTREARSLWEKIHADRSRAFSIEGEGWVDAPNVIEKWLAYAPGNVLGQIRELALVKTASWDGPAAHDQPQMVPLDQLHGVASMNYPGFTLGEAWRYRHPEDRTRWDIDNAGASHIVGEQTALREHVEATGQIPGYLTTCSHGSVLEDGEHRYMAARDAGLDEVPVKRARGCLMPELHRYSPAPGGTAKTAGREEQLAAMDRGTRASALAQEHTRYWHPRTTLPLSERSGQNNLTMTGWLAEAGVPRADESFVAQHRSPDRLQSNTARGPDGEPGVALHPDRWDYGTMAHETAHLIHDHETGRPFRGPEPEGGTHNDRWAAIYAGLLNQMEPEAGDTFLAQRRQHLGLSAEAAAPADAYYHGTWREFQPGDSIEAGHERSVDNFLPGKSEHVFYTTDPDWADRVGNLSAEHSYGTHSRVYEVRPTGPGEPDTLDSRGLSFKSRDPLQVVREVRRRRVVPPGDGSSWGHYEIHEASLTNEVPLAAVSSAGRLEHIEHEPKTAVAGPAPLENPYHGGTTWYHGTRGALTPESMQGGYQLKESDRATSGMGGQQWNKYLGTHFDPLHSVAHHFTASGMPSSIHHAELLFRNPAHFESEDHLLMAGFRWAAAHHPAFHEPLPNSGANSAYDPETGPEQMSHHLVRADRELAPDDPNRRYKLKSMVENFYQWHPKAHEMARGFVQHLAEQGHHGITYGNGVEGPKDHVSAIATDPSQFRVTHTERLHPLGEPVKGQDGKLAWDEEAKDWHRHPVQIPEGHTTYPESAKLNESPEFLIGVANRHHPGIAKIDKQGPWYGYPDGPPKRVEGWSYQAAREPAGAAVARTVEPGNFYHGTDKPLEEGSLLDPDSPHRWEDSRPDSVYFTNHPLVADWYSTKGNSGEGFVYEVRPEGEYHEDEHPDPNLSPGDVNYRSSRPVRVIRRVPQADLDRHWAEFRRQAAREPERPDKTKDEVHYRKAAGMKRCGTCTMLRLLPPDFESAHCTLVKGLIEQDDVCDEWYQDDEHKADGSTKKAASLEPASDAATHVGAQPAEDSSSELPVRHGLWYRAHPEQGFPIDAGRARSRGLHDPGIGQAGLSSFAHPQHLMGYLGALSWYDHDDDKAAWSPDTGEHKIIAFHGREVGRGVDDEPLVMPRPDRSCCGRIVHGVWSLPRFERLADERYPNPTGAITWSTSTHDASEERRSGDRGRHRRQAVTGYQGLTGKSAYIFLQVPDGLVERVPGGVDDEQHITICYLGKNVGDTAFAKAVLRARIAAQHCQPLSGVLHGVETFDPDEHGKVPAFVPAYVPGIGQLANALKDLSASQHANNFRPHVTLAYLEPGDDLPDPRPPVKVRFDRLYVKRGEEMVSFPLGRTE